MHNLIEQSRQFDALKKDLSGKEWLFDFNMDCHLTATERLTGNYGILKQLTEWAWGQLCGRLGPSVFGAGSARSVPRDFVMAIAERFPADTACLLNSLIEKYTGEFFIRTYKTEELGRFVRAVLSDKYAVIDNTEVLTMAEAALQSGSRKVLDIVRPLVTPDRIDVKVVTENHDNGLSGAYGIGFYLTNDETGAGRIELTGLIQNNRSTNSIILNAEKSLSVFHRGNKDTLKTMLVGAIDEALVLSQKYLRRYLASKQIEIDSMHPLIHALEKQNHWSTEITESVIRANGGGNTLYSLINAITIMAHTELSGTDTIAAERLAGEILHDPSQFFGKPDWVLKYLLRVGELEKAEEIVNG